MAKGLGVRQWQFLEALAVLEDKQRHHSGDIQHRRFFAPTTIAKQVWGNECEEKRQLLVKEYKATFKARRAAAHQPVTAAAVIESAGEDDSGSPSKEPDGVPDPSPIVASLARRGLVEFSPVRAGGARLTDKGRALVEKKWELAPRARAA